MIENVNGIGHPAFDTQTERGVIGCILDDPDRALLLVKEQLASALFFDPLCKSALWAIGEDLEDGIRPDVRTVTDRLTRANKIEEVGGAYPITQLIDPLNRSNIHNLAFEVEELRDKAVQRWAMGARITGETTEEILLDLDAKKAAVREIQGFPAIAAATLGSLEPPKPDDGKTLLGNRYLERGAGALLVGPTGIGKSSLAMQAAVCWARAKPCFGIAPARYLKSLIIQAENDAGDLAEMRDGVFDGLGNIKNNILDPQGAAAKGAESLLSKFKGSSVALGIAAAEGVALVKTLQGGMHFATGSAEGMTALAEEMRRTSAVNVFASSAEGVDSLADKLADVRQQIRDANTAQQQNNPYGFGGGTVGNMKTALAQAAQAKADLLSEIPEKIRGYAGAVAKVALPGTGILLANQLNAAGTAGYSSADRQRDAAAQLKGEQDLAGQRQAKLQKDIAASSERSLMLARAEASGDHLRVDLARARLDLETKIAGVRSKNAATPGVLRDIEDNARLQRQTGKLRHRSDYGEAVGANLSAGIAPGINQELIRAQVARLTLQFQARTALQRPGGMFKTEALGWNTKLREANNNVNASALDAKRRTDSVVAGKLEISNRRELVKLGFQDIAAQTRLADLNIQAAQAAQDQAYTMGDQVKASNALKEAVAARVALERASVAVQHAQGEIAYDLARRNLAIQSTNNSEISKRTQLTEASMSAAQRELSMGRGLTEERKRQLRLEIGGGGNNLRELRQQRGFGKSALQIQKDIRGEADRTRALDRFDARQRRDNGLINIQRGMNGEILSGTDMLTGKKRGYSAGATMMKETGHDTDTAKGNTLLSATRATVDALDVANAYHKQIQTDISMMAANWGLKV